MKSLLRASRVVAVIVLTLTMALSMAGRSYADTATSQLTILPVCSDGANNTAQWSVTNTNSVPVTVSYTTDNSAQTDTWTVPANDTNDTTLTTKFGTDDSAVRFVQNGIAQVITNAPCSSDYYEGCVIVSNTTPFVEEWTSKNTLSISTAGWDPEVSPGGAPFCEDTSVDITLTSYTLPAGYDGNFFPGNTTSVPQMVSYTQTVNLHNTYDDTEGSDYPEYVAPVELTVKLPDPCDNVRVSLTHSNMIGQIQASAYTYPSGTVTTPAYDSSYIGGGLYQATSTCPAPQVLGASTSVPTLTDTGLNIRLTSIISAVLMASAIIVFRTQPKAAKQ